MVLGQGYNHNNNNNTFSRVSSQASSNEYPDSCDKVAPLIRVSMPSQELMRNAAAACDDHYYLPSQY